MRGTYLLMTALPLEQRPDNSLDNMLLLFLNKSTIRDPRYILLTLLTGFTLLTLLTLFILLKLLYTAKTLACMPIYIVRES